MTSSSSDELDITPPDIMQEAQEAMDCLLPAKSRDKYLNTYENFLQWKQNKNASSFSENVLMAYFNEPATNYKPSTLWARYSMLKSTIKTKHNVDIANYSKLTAFLKRKSCGFKSKKSKVLSSSDVKRFLNEAPDNIYLATKVALIFRITGACRRDELMKITVDDMTQQGDVLVVKIPDTKTHICRTFIIEGELYTIVKKYKALRSNKCTSYRFFQNYQNGKCINQCIGINKFGAMPKQIATFLNLPEPELYTGHSFRRTSATLLADSGASLTTLKRHGGWKSNSVAESYIEDSLENKRNICAKISRRVNLKPETKQYPSTSEDLNVKNTEPQPSTSKKPDIVHMEPQPSTFNDNVHIHPSDGAIPIESHSFVTSMENEPERENKTASNLSQTIKFADKTLTFNIQNCSNINFNFNN